jgi:hypothetical protein
MPCWGLLQRLATSGTTNVNAIALNLPSANKIEIFFVVRFHWRRSGAGGVVATGGGSGAESSGPSGDGTDHG